MLFSCDAGAGDTLDYISRSGRYQEGITTSVGACPLNLIHSALPLHNHLFCTVTSHKFKTRCYCIYKSDIYSLIPQRI